MKTLYLDGPFLSAPLISCLMIQIYYAFTVRSRQLNVNSIISNIGKVVQNPYWHWVSANFSNEAQAKIPVLIRIAVLYCPASLSDGDWVKWGVMRLTGRLATAGQSKQNKA
jgi:hypothetical protein